MQSLFLSQSILLAETFSAVVTAWVYLESTALAFVTLTPNHRMEHNAAGRFSFLGAFRFHASWFFAPHGSCGALGHTLTGHGLLPHLAHTVMWVSTGFLPLILSGSFLLTHAPPHTHVSPIRGSCGPTMRCTESAWADSVCAHRVGGHSSWSHGGRGFIADL